MTWEYLSTFISFSTLTEPFFETYKQNFFYHNHHKLKYKIQTVFRKIRINRFFMTSIIQTDFLHHDIKQNGIREKFKIGYLLVVAEKRIILSNCKSMIQQFTIIEQCIASRYNEMVKKTGVSIKVNIYNKPFQHHCVPNQPALHAQHIAFHLSGASLLTFHLLLLCFLF